MRARLEIKMEFLDDQLALARIWPWSYLRAILEPTDAGDVVRLDILGFSPLSPLPPGLSSTFLPSFQSSLSAIVQIELQDRGVELRDTEYQTLGCEIRYYNLGSMEMT